MRTLIGISFVLAAGGSVHGREIVVDLNGDGEFTEIQPAIDAAGVGDTVIVKAGEYVITEPINFNRLHNREDPNSPPLKNLILRAEAGPEVTTIRMSDIAADPGRASVVIFENGETGVSRLEGFTLTGGRGTTWDGDRWRIGGGGGILCKGSSPAISDCRIAENYSFDPRAPSVWPDIAGGGGVGCWNASPTLMGCTIEGNSLQPTAMYPGEFGGGLACSGPGSSPSLTDCTISGNLANSCIDCSDGSSPELRGSTIAGNLSGVHCSEGSAASLTDCTIVENGGGVYCRSGSSPTLTGCTLEGNFASAVTCQSGASPLLQGCTIAANSGNGVMCPFDASPILRSCSISGNKGSGLYCSDSSPTLTNCTIYGNEFGGVKFRAGSFPLLANCTVSGNLAGGVGCFDNSSPTLLNCIVWGNFRESVCGQLSHCITDADPLFVDPGLFDFQRFVTVNVGGREHLMPHFIVEQPDYRLQTGSPAIDAATLHGAPPTDIRGHGRPCGGGVDIGAYESGDCPPPLSFRRGEANADTGTDLSDAVFVLGYLFMGGAEPSCQKSADVDDNGSLEISDAVYLLNFLFLSGPVPSEPFAGCGPDPTVDDLTCERYPPCG